jgi:hypothetical protein
MFVTDEPSSFSVSVFFSFSSQSSVTIGVLNVFSFSSLLTLQCPASWVVCKPWKSSKSSLPQPLPSAKVFSWWTQVICSSVTSKHSAILCVRYAVSMMLIFSLSFLCNYDLFYTESFDFSIAGDNPTITELADYTAFCGASPTDKVRWFWGVFMFLFFLVYPILMMNIVVLSILL